MNDRNISLWILNLVNDHNDPVMIDQEIKFLASTIVY